MDLVDKFFSLFSLLEKGGKPEKKLGRVESVTKSGTTRTSEDKITNFLSKQYKMLRENKLGEVGSADLASYQKDMTDVQKMIFLTQYNSVKKDRNTVLILSILLGWAGIDRFYVGDIGAGVIKLLTAGLFGIWYIIDWFLIMNIADGYNRNKAKEISTVIKSST